MLVLTRDFPFLSLLSYLCFYCPKRKWGQLSNIKYVGFKVVHCPGISTALLPVGAHYAALLPGRGIFVLSAHSVVKVQLQLRKSSRGLLSVWEFTLRDCCAIMATIRICIFCCRHPNVSNLCVRFVWRTDKIYFQNSYCRIGGAKNE